MAFPLKGIKNILFQVYFLLLVKFHLIRLLFFLSYHNPFNFENWQKKKLKKLFQIKKLNVLVIKQINIVD